MLSSEILNAKREEFESYVTITGIAVSLGTTKISTLEKVKTIKSGAVEVQAEAEKVVKGLGIKSTTVANIGENIITNAALAVVKLILSYGVDPADIKTLVVATETPQDISESMAVEVKDAVNKVLAALNRRGYSFGQFEPLAQLHVQSACASAGLAISNFALNGINGGKAIVVATDSAEYALHTPPDETGGFGSVAVLLEKTSSNTNGIMLSSKIGHFSRKVPDFLKPIIKDLYGETGLELVAKYPIVFGKFSEETYFLADYESVKSIMREMGKSISDLSLHNSLSFISHIPTVAMPEKAFAYLFRHFTRYDSELKSRLEAELGGAAEPFLDGFTRIEDELSFIMDFNGLYYSLVGVPKELDARLGARDKNGNVELAERMLNANRDLILRYIQNETREIAARYKPTGELGASFISVIENLESLRSSERTTLQQLDDAFKPARDIIAAFEAADNDYVKRIRSTTIFKEYKKRMSIDESVRISSMTGNLYTGSAPLGLASYLSYSDFASTNDILMMFYGSGLETSTIYGKPRNIEKMIETVKRNVDTELNSLREISAGEYESIRKNSVLLGASRPAPLISNSMFRMMHVNEAELTGNLAPYLSLYERARSESSAQSFKQKDLVA